jgi:hypothetical protein
MRNSSKTNKKRTSGVCASSPWQCEPCTGGYEISAFVEASGKWEAVATVKKTSKVSAAMLARHIVDKVNAGQTGDDLLTGALAALEAVSSEGLTFSTEHDVDIMIRRIKQHSVGKK